jgi:hypothetical protein
VDTNGDGVISADQIKNSAEAIRKLDKQGPRHRNRLGKSD